MTEWFLTFGLGVALLGGGVWLFLRLANNAYRNGYAAGKQRKQYERDNTDYQRGYNAAYYGTPVAPTPYYVTNWPQLKTIDGEVVK